MFIPIWGILNFWTTSEVDGTATTYRNHPVATLAIVGVGLVLAGMGVQRCWEAASQMMPQPIRRKRGTEWSAPDITGENVGMTLLGLGVIVFGGGVVGIVGPSTAYAFVTVAEDRVIIRDHLFWYDETPRVYLYSLVGIPRVDTEERTGRRGARVRTDYLTETQSKLRVRSVPQKRLVPGVAVGAKTVINAGDSLLCEWFTGIWQPVTVLDTLPGGDVQIHWENESDVFDIRVPRAKLRARR